MGRAEILLDFDGFSQIWPDFAGLLPEFAGIRRILTA